ncbi:MAG: hypothetical protein ACLSHM_01655 [Vescimonas sp.]
MSDQQVAKELKANYDHLILVCCGHYEGVDQRFLDDMRGLRKFPSATSSSPAARSRAMAVADRLCQHGSRRSAGRRAASTDESHWNGLLEYPQYSRPEVWHGRADPSGAAVRPLARSVDDRGRRKATKRTMRRRPDMFAKFDESRLTTKLSTAGSCSRPREELRQDQESAEET